MTFIGSGRGLLHDVHRLSPKARQTMRFDVVVE